MKDKEPKKKVVYSYKCPNKTFIKASVLSKAPKGHYKNDIISLKMKSINGEWDLLLTPKEAIVISTGLGVAVIESEYVNKDKELSS